MGVSKTGVPNLDRNVLQSFPFFPNTPLYRDSAGNPRSYFQFKLRTLKGEVVLLEGSPDCLSYHF